MRIASIDIGSNTILMLVADIDEGGTLRVVADEQAIARLGEGINVSGVIGTSAFERASVILSAYLKRAGALNPERIIATGTSALRDARNQEDFLLEMRVRFGLPIEVLSGDDEARLTYRGTLSGFPDGPARYAVLDIGGGSTELCVGDRHDISAQRSLDIGCVRLTERFLHDAPPSLEDRADMEDAVLRTIRAFPAVVPESTTFVAVAGTPATLAAMDLGLPAFDREAVSGHILTTERIRQFYEEFSRMSHAELLACAQVDPGRADILLAGTCILFLFLRWNDVQSVVVSERGLRYGIALREWDASASGAAAP